MDIVNYILPIITAMIGGGATWIFTIKFDRQHAEAAAMEKLQDVYKRMIEDLNADRERLGKEMKEQAELQQELKNKINELENVKIRNLEDAVAANSKILKRLAELAKAQQVKCKDCILIELINKSQI